MNNIKVRQIIETREDYSQVVVDANTFRDVIGVAPKTPHTTARDVQGKGVRVFDLNGTKLYTQFKPGEGEKRGTTIIIMHKNDAARLLLPLETERAK